MVAHVHDCSSWTIILEKEEKRKEKKKEEEEAGVEPKPLGWQSGALATTLRRI